MPEVLWDCPDCGAPSAIYRDRQSVVIPNSLGTLTRTEHADGDWCETITLRPTQEV